jgi:hypothetical protein
MSPERAQGYFNDHLAETRNHFMIKIYSKIITIVRIEIIIMIMIVIKMVVVIFFLVPLKYLQES